MPRINRSEGNGRVGISFSPREVATKGLPIAALIAALVTAGGQTIVDDVHKVITTYGETQRRVAKLENNQHELEELVGEIHITLSVMEATQKDLVETLRRLERLARETLDQQEESP